MMLLLLSPHCAACRVRACWFNLHNTPQPPWVPPRVKNIQLRYSPCMLSSANAAASLRDRLELLVVSSARSSSSASSKPWRRSSLMSGSSSLQLDAWNNETRLVFESCVADARACPADMIHAVLFHPGIDSTQSSPLCFAKQLIAVVIAGARGLQPQSQLFGDCVDLLDILARDRSLQLTLLEAHYGLMELIVKNIALLNDNLPKVLNLVKTLTRNKTAPLTSHISLLVSFLRQKIMSPTPNPDHLAILVQLCRNPEVSKDLLASSGVDKFFRFLFRLLGEENFNCTVAVHSLHLLVCVIIDDPMGEKFFSDENMIEALKLSLNILVRGQSEVSQAAAIAFLDGSSNHQRLHATLTRYLSEKPCLRPIITKLSSSPTLHKNLFHFLAVLLEHRFCVEILSDIIIEMNLICLSMTSLKQTIQDNPDGGTKLSYFCRFIHALVELIKDSSHPAHPLTKLSTELGLKTCQFAKSLSEMLPLSLISASSSMIETAVLTTTNTAIAAPLCDPPATSVAPAPQDSLLPTPLAVMDLLYTLDVLISCAETLQLRKETLGMIPLDPFIAFLESICRPKGSKNDNSSSWISVVPVTIVLLEELRGSVNSSSTRIDGTSRINVRDEPLTNIPGVREAVVAAFRNCRDVRVVESCLRFFGREDKEKRLENRREFARIVVSIMGRCSGDGRVESVSGRLGGSSANGSVEFCGAGGVLDEGRLSTRDVSLLDVMTSFREMELTETSSQIEEAERSILALSNLEKEVESIAERMRQEMALKEQISERKIAVHESKTGLLKAEVSQLKELVEERNRIIRNLEVTEGDYKKKFSDVSAMLEKKTADYEEQLSDRDLEVSRLRSSESLLNLELQKMQARFAEAESKIETLSKSVKVYEDKNKEHDDLVSRLAQLASIATKK